MTVANHGNAAHHDRYGSANTDVLDDGHGGGDHDHAPHGTLKGYLTGFVLAAILTIIPFWLVMGRPIESTQITAFVVVAFAAVQIVVHMIFFLHMDPRAESGWNFMALIFTAVVLFIAVSGTLWVMYHMNANMMPIHDMEAL